MRAARTVLAALGVIVAASGLAGCGGNRTQEPVTEAPVVTVSKPVEKNVTDYEDFTGRTEAIESVEVRARVTGYLTQIAFQEGAEVAPGDVLFRIDPRPYQAELDRQNGQIKLADARMRLVQADYDRARRLAGTSAISSQELETYAAKVAETKASLEAAEAAAESARLNLEFCTITAPIRGKIGRAMITLGNLVTADNTLLTTIVSVDPIYIYFNPDERTYLRVQELIRQGKFVPSRVVGREQSLDAASAAGFLATPAGMAPLTAAASAPPGRKWVVVPVLAGLATDKGKDDEFPYKGSIDFVNNQVDAATGTITVRGLFPNGQRILSPGLFTRVRLPIGAPHKALMVSERALGTSQGQKFVYVVNDNNEVVYRAVELGPLRDGLRVITKGVGRDDRLIVNGLQRVRPGVTVDPKEGEMVAGAEAGPKR